MKNVLQTALVAWMVDGTEPPSSGFPTLAAGDLLADMTEAMGNPALPGVPLPTGLAARVMNYAFGNEQADVPSVLHAAPLGTYTG